MLIGETGAGRALTETNYYLAGFRQDVCKAVRNGLASIDWPSNVVFDAGGTMGIGVANIGAQGRAAASSLQYPHLTSPISLVAWRTASGRLVPHIVYSLIGCPTVEAASYMLVRRSEDGRRKVLHIARTEATAACLNLARIRHDGARLGANEVHLYVLGASDDERAQTASDLAAAHASVVDERSAVSGACCH